MTLTDYRPDAADVVERGAALLDERLPGWDERIDLNILRIADTSQCVLGQLFDEPQQAPTWAVNGFASLDDAVTTTLLYDSRAVNELTAEYSRTSCVANYNLGRYALGLNGDDMDAYGFEAFASEFTYDDLDEAWAWLINERHIARSATTA